MHQCKKLYLQLCSDISTARATSFWIFLTASLSSGDKTTCVMPLETQEFNPSILRNSCMESYEKKHLGMKCRRKLPWTTTVAWSIVQVHHHCPGFLRYYSLHISYLVYGILHQSPLTSPEITYCIAVLHWNDFMYLQLLSFESIPVFCYNHHCSAVATNHLHLELTTDSNFASHPSLPILIDAIVSFTLMWGNMTGQL